MHVSFIPPQKNLGLILFERIHPNLSQVFCYVYSRKEYERSPLGISLEEFNNFKNLSILIT